MDREGNRRILSRVYWIVQQGWPLRSFSGSMAIAGSCLTLMIVCRAFPTDYVTDADSDHSTELGKGTIAWPALLRQAGEQGIRYTFWITAHRPVRSLIAWDRASII
jgi:hypothetical protein